MREHCHPFTHRAQKVQSNDEYLRRETLSVDGKMNVQTKFEARFSSSQKDPVPDDYDQQIPEQKTIYRFMRIIFTAAQLTAECAIVTLVRSRDR